MNRRDFFSHAAYATGAATVIVPTLLSGPVFSDTKDEDGTTNPSEFKKIKIAQIGVRHEHASGKMNSMKLLPQYYEVLGIAAESPEEEEKHKSDREYQNVKWMSKDDIFKLPGLEAVAVETEMTELIPTAIECAKRGLHLHVDKPLGQNLDECQKLLDVCKQNQVIMQPGYMYRTNQAFRLAMHGIKEGWFGEVFDITANMNRNDSNRPGFRKWHATYRGGGMYNYGSHLVDFIVEMYGAPNSITVFESPDPTDKLSDNTLSVLRYGRTIVQLRVNMRTFPIDRFLTVSGTEGTFTLRPLEKFERDPKTGITVPLHVEMTLQKSNAEYKAGTHHLEIPPFDDRYIGQLTNLAQYIRGLEKNPYSYEHELLVQKVILAASGYFPWEPQK